MSENQQDGRHPASAIRLQQAQQQGDFPRSVELASSLQLTFGVAACYLLASSVASQLKTVTQAVWSKNAISLDANEAAGAINGLVVHVFWIVAPLLFIILIVAFLSHLIQNTSFSFFNRPLFDFSTLNPAKNTQRVFSLQNGLRGVLGLPKIVLTLSVIAAVGWYLMERIGGLAFMPVVQMLEEMMDCVFVVLLAATVTLCLISAIDYIIERFSFLRRHRMTDEQLRDESRLQNVDPQVGAKRQQFYQDNA